MQFQGFTFKKIAWLLVGLIFLIFAVFHYEVVFSKLGRIRELLDPFFLGLCFAFLINFPMRWIERKFLKKAPFAVARPLSFIISILILLVIIAIILIIIIPQLGSSIVMLFNSLPGYITKIQNVLKPYSEEFPQIQTTLQNIKTQIPQVSAHLTTYAKDNMSSLITTTTTFLQALLRGISSFFVSLVFASLVILNKEKLFESMKRFTSAFFPTSVQHQFGIIVRTADRIFSSFVTGTCLESLVVGIIFFLVLLIGQFQYALLIATFVAIVSLVPMIGKSLASTLGLFLTLISQGFWRAIAFFIVFFIVNNLCSILLHPRLVSRSLGMPGMWSFFAATIGAKVFGIWGIFLCIPVASLAYSLLTMNVKVRLDRKQHITENKK